MATESSESTPSNTSYPMPPASADMDTIWSFLEEGIDHIMNKLQTGVSSFKYMSLYTVAYNYCMSSRMHGSPDRTVGRTGATLMGSDLYSNLIQYFVTHLKGLKEERQSDAVQDEALLRYYAAEWDRYRTGACYINRVFMFLNRHWIKRERDEGRKGVYPVYILALVQWKLNFFLQVQSKNGKLAGAIVRLVERQRNGESIDQGLVKTVVDSFVSLGSVDEGDINKASLDVYKEHLEAPFLEATEKYYQQESEAFLAERSVSDYLKKAEERLREEEDRVDRYLNTSTRKPLVSKCEHVLIRQHSELISESFQTLLLDFDTDDDVQRMYALLSRIPEGSEPLMKKFEEHVKRAGLIAVSNLVGEGSEGTDGPDPTAYVDALWEVHRENSETVTRSFRGEAGFVASLDKACREFVNRNAATRLLTTKSPELLAEHADMLLRKNNRMAEEEDLEGSLNRVMMLFKYIEDKDVFQTFYTTKLSKRLIHGVSASDESEASMISKLKEACGVEYTNKLQRMFTEKSHDVLLMLTDQFKGWMQQNHDDMNIHFSIMVLGTSFWPLNAPSDFIVPPEILPTYDRFSKYYKSKHSGRNLTWMWNYSKHELRTNYLNRKYILMTSSYQMAVLLQYNDHDTLSLEELWAATAISKDNLVEVLSFLVKVKILVNKEMDQYDLNPNFKSKKIRVGLNQPIQAAESSKVLKAVDEDRKYVIQATIVRIIKARKTVKNQPLIQEVISQISARFAPKLPDIKKAIDTLLERNFIERVDGARDTFVYVA
ncbi:Cullin-domain-containing protein [Chiua virens]|nr:Cullin-domain-containing protein [Chiua virens]